MTIDPPLPFSSDGCSSPKWLLPRLVWWNHEHWRGCCEVHDLAYWRGGTRDERWDADLQLRRCIAANVFPIVAVLMFVAVRLFGGPERDVSYRWGFGWPFGFGYLDDEE